MNGSSVFLKNKKNMNRILIQNNSVISNQLTINTNTVNEFSDNILIINNNVDKLDTRVENSLIGTNLYFFDYNNIYYTSYKDYAKGVQLFNNILNINYNFNSITLDYNDFEDVINLSITDSNNLYNNFNSNFNKLVKDSIGDTNYNNSVMINNNLEDNYNLIIEHFYNVAYQRQKEDNNPIVNPTDALNKWIESNTFLFNKNNFLTYISWGNLTPELVYIRDKNYIDNSNNINKLYNLINFGPSYYDELFRLNLIINELNGNLTDFSNINTISNTCDFTNTIIYYLIIDGDFYNSALRFLYNYCSKLTIYTLISQVNNDIIYDSDICYNNLSTINIVNATNEDGETSLYNRYINNVYENGKIYNFDRQSYSNNFIDDDPKNFPEIVLINIPNAENNEDYNNNKLGKGINKSLDVMRKHYNLNKNKQSYIYVKTESETGEKTLLENIKKEDKVYSDSNKYFYDSNMFILSSYNNIEYTLKYYTIANYSKLNILSSYNLDCSNEILNYFEELSNNYFRTGSDLNTFFEGKEKTTFNLTTYPSFQQFNKSILECLMIYYIIILSLMSSGNNFQERRSSSDIKETYYNYLDLFMIDINNINTDIFGYTFNKLISKFNSTVNRYNNDDLGNIDNLYSLYNGGLGESYDNLPETIKNNSFIRNNSRIRTFSLYQYNSNSFTELSNNIPVYTLCDNFEGAISSVYQELIMLKSNVDAINDNSINILDIIDFNNSLLSVSNGNNSNEILNNIIEKYEIKVRFVETQDSSNVIINYNSNLVNYGNIPSYQDGISIINGDIGLSLSNSSESGFINIQFILKSKNIYKNENYYIHSNDCRVNVK